MTNFRALARARALELLPDERRSIPSTVVGVFARSVFVLIAAGRNILGVYTFLSRRSTCLSLSSNLSSGHC